MIGCVVLNYNDYETTVQLLEKIKNYTILDKIIVVDGASTDCSYDVLRKYISEKIEVILADKNGGYGYGNNIGIKRCKELGIKYVLVANPDVGFKEKSIQRIYDYISNDSRCVAISPRMKDREPAMRIISPWKDVWASFIFINAVAKPRNYPSKYYEGRNLVKVDAVPGSLVLFDIDKFIECGLYDESIFLYHEELSIGMKYREKGFTSYILLSEEYIHNHSVTVSKVYKDSLKRKTIGLKSHKIYLSKYLHAPQTVMLLFTFLYPFFCAESIIWGMIKWMKVWCGHEKADKRKSWSGIKRANKRSNSTEER